MPVVRPFRAVALAAALALPAPALAAPPCVTPAEAAAFDVVALKTEMMVTALLCRSDAQYNSVIRRFRAPILSGERTVQAWFGRAGGGRSGYDAYITQIANARSAAAIVHGDGFCEVNGGLFREILAARRPGDVGALATRKAFPQPLALKACAAEATPRAAEASVPVPGQTAHPALAAAVRADASPVPPPGIVPVGAAPASAETAPVPSPSSPSVAERASPLPGFDPAAR